jgi:hypothetical protein
MISLETIEQEILELETRDTTWTNVERLAWLYVVRDHLVNNRRGELLETFVSDNLGEFLDACNGLALPEILSVLNEHLEAIKLIYPREYDLIIQRLKKLKH